MPKLGLSAQADRSVLVPCTGLFYGASKRLRRKPRALSCPESKKRRYMEGMCHDWETLFRDAKSFCPPVPVTYID